jgi:hypothetical protein
MARHTYQNRIGLARSSVRRAIIGAMIAAAAMSGACGGGGVAGGGAEATGHGLSPSQPYACSEPKEASGKWRAGDGGSCYTSEVDCPDGTFEVDISSWHGGGECTITYSCCDDPSQQMPVPKDRDGYSPSR